jgi:hypothetical protein
MPADEKTGLAGRRAARLGGDVKAFGRVLADGVGFLGRELKYARFLERGLRLVERGRVLVRCGCDEHRGDFGRIAGGNREFAFADVQHSAAFA